MLGAGFRSRAVAYCQSGTPSTFIVSSSGRSNPKCCATSARRAFAAREVSGFGGAIADDVDVLVHDVDAAFPGDGAGENVVREKGRRVGGYEVIHHLEIDGVLLLHGGDPALDLLAVTGDVSNKNPIVAFADEAVGRCAGRDRSAVNGYREGASAGAQARVNHVSGAADCDGDEHVLSHAFAARFEEDDAGCVSDGGEADRIESGVHEACVLEAVAAATGGDDLSMQSFRVEPDGAAEKDVEAFEGDAGDMGLEDFERGCRRSVCGGQCN